VVDAPYLTLWGTGGTDSGVEIFDIHFESVLDAGPAPSIVNASTLEGWTLVTTGEQSAGGTNAFEVWHDGDQTTNADGDAVSLVSSQSSPGDHYWISLADASGSGTQTLGIERTFNSVFGAVYSLNFDVAGEPGFDGRFGGYRVEVNGEELETRFVGSGDDELGWDQRRLQFEGTGAPMTIRILAAALDFAPDGRGVMIDNIWLDEHTPNVGAKNSWIGLQQIVAWPDDEDGSETLQLFIDNVPVGASLDDGVHVFTATAGNTTVNITGWAMGDLCVKAPTGYFGNFEMTVRAVSTDTATSTTSTKTRALRVHVLNQTSPIVLDLDGNGIRTVSVDDSVGTFDLLNTGTPVRSGWISSGDAFLAVDLNRNGAIDDRGELFGGDVGAGFAKLATYDSNGDHVIDKRDARFKDLRLWRDLNGNHRTDKGELVTLKKSGVKSLDVGYEIREETQNGNRFIERGHATRADGSRIEMSDVYFPTAAAETMGASVGPGWNEPKNKAARIIVQSALRNENESAKSSRLIDRMLNSFAPATSKTADMKLPAAPSFKTAQSVRAGDDVARSSPKPQPQVDAGVKVTSGLPASSPKSPPDALIKNDATGPRSSPKLDPQSMPDVATIDWNARLFTDAIGETSAAGREVEWLGEMLGVKKPRRVDLGKLTGLNIRLPHR
jgi:hypothetical protein